VEGNLSSFLEAGRALLAIRDERLYRAYGTWEQYCRRRFGITQSRGLELAPLRPRIYLMAGPEARVLEFLKMRNIDWRLACTWPEFATAADKYPGPVYPLVLDCKAPAGLDSAENTQFGSGNSLWTIRRWSPKIGAVVWYTRFWAPQGRSLKPRFRKSEFRLNGIYDFLAISRYVHTHRWKNAEYAPVEHGPIKHAPDLAVYDFANFAFVDHLHRLGCK
jgi:hypothetical protein